MPRVSARLKGMAIGSLFMTGFGALWMVLALNAASWIWLVACIFVPASLLLMRALGLLHASQRAAAGEPPATLEEVEELSRTRRHFAWVFLTETGAIAVIANLLAVTHRADWIPAAIGVVVGLHFLPLARLFNFSLYNWTGVIEVALCVAVALALRHHLPAADPLIGLIMGLSLWLTVIIVLAQGRRMAA